MCKEFSSCEEWGIEEDEKDYVETYCPNDFEDFSKIDLETFVISECEGDFIYDVTNVGIEYKSVEFIDIDQGYEIDEEDCCFVAPHDILKLELECFIMHEDNFVEKVNDDASSSYSDLSVHNVDQEPSVMIMENISELEWFSNVDCSDIDI